MNMMMVDEDIQNEVWSENRQQWLEERGCTEQDVEMGQAGEFVMVQHEGGLRKVYLPDVLQTGYEQDE